MAEAEIKLSGWHAVVAIVALGVFLVFRILSMGDASGDEALMQKLKVQLASEYYPGEAERLRVAMDSGDAAEIDAVAQSVINTRLNLDEVKTSFPLFDFSSSKDVVVKVAYSLEDNSGTHHADTKYYLYRYGAIGDNWSYQYEVSAVSFYLNFM